MASIVSISSSICNDGETTTTDLNNLLPAGTPTNGTGRCKQFKCFTGKYTLMLLLFSKRLHFEYKVNDATCPNN
jgi:hypothetical protein